MNSRRLLAEADGKAMITLRFFGQYIMNKMLEEFF